LHFDPADKIECLLQSRGDDPAFAPIGLALRPPFRQLEEQLVGHDAAEAAQFLEGEIKIAPVKVDIAQPVIRKIRPLSAAEAALIPEVIA
jgi:hypothetical protein